MVSNYIRFLFLASILILVVSALPIAAQDTTPLPTDATIDPVTAPALPSLTATPPAPEATPDDIALTTVGVTLEITPSLIPDFTELPSSTEAATAEVTADVLATLELTVEVTDAATSADIPETTVEATAETESTEATAEATAEATTVVESTETAVETTAEATTEAESTETAADTATPVALVPLRGIARYQNHVPDDSGITVEVLDSDMDTLSTASTMPDGQYEVLVPETGYYWLVITAPRHLRTEVGIWSGEPVPEVILAGGDLDANGCVDERDVVLLTAEFELSGVTADITGNGLTDAADLAILAGNFGSGQCITSPPTVEASPTAAIEMATPEITETLSPTIEVTPEVTTEAVAETAAPLPEATLEAGTSG